MARRLTVHRKGYTREAYTRKGGIRVKRTRVPATTFSIKDRGAPGRGRKVIKIRHPGRLTRVGYNVRAPAASRRRALRKAVGKYGERSTIGMLHAQAVYRKRTDSVGRTFARDRTWVAKQYGTYRGRRRESMGRRLMRGY